MQLISLPKELKMIPKIFGLTIEFGIRYHKSNTYRILTNYHH